jgi:peptidoglycan/xylan/chitin deacetylase (PgdA/CDA1 family)
VSIVTHQYKSTVWQKIERRIASWTLGRPAKLDLASGIVSFTFDDAPQSACRRGREILERHDTRGTYYICGACTGLRSATGPFHTREDLLRLKENNHELGCHGFGHRSYQTISKDMIRADIIENRRFFERQLSTEAPPNFAYPFGCVSPATKQIIAKEFTSGRGGRHQSNVGHVDLALLSSMQLYERIWNHTSLGRCIEKAAENREWLIFVSHDVIEEPSEFGCKPALLEFAVKRAREFGLRVIPIGDALDSVLSGGSVRGSHSS